jgi:hypothetical protein
LGVDPNLDKHAQSQILAFFLRTFLSVFIFNHGGREFSLARCGPGEGEDVTAAAAVKDV